MAEYQYREITVSTQDPGCGDDPQQEINEKTELMRSSGFTFFKQERLWGGVKIKFRREVRA